MGRKIYCDGACAPNPGYMGAGVFIPLAGRIDYGLELALGWGTNQQAELIALTRAIELANDGDEIFTYSQYALGMAQGWKARANHAQVNDLRAALKGKRVTLSWIRGHNGDQAQERADELAVAGSEQSRRTGIDSS